MKGLSIVKTGGAINDIYTLVTAIWSSKITKGIAIESE